MDILIYFQLPREWNFKFKFQKTVQNILKHYCFSKIFVIYNKKKKDKIKEYKKSYCINSQIDIETIYNMLIHGFTEKVINKNINMSLKRFLY